MANAGYPMVSVILPTYNRAQLVGRALRSVLDQTYRDFELIVVDDGSSDHTAEVVRSFADPRIRYLCHDENRGAAAARNTGIGAARGEYVAFLDSDDEWLPEKLRRQIEVLQEAPPTVGVIYTDMWRISKEGKKYWHSSRAMPEDGIVYQHVLDDQLVGICMPSVAVRRGCFAKVGNFDEKFPRLIERDLLIRMAKYFHFCHIEEPLVNHYDTGEGISSDNRLLIRALKLILEKYRDDIEENRKSLARHQYVIGNLLCQSGEMDEGRTYLLGAVKSYPLNIKYLIAAIASSFGQAAYNKTVKLKRIVRPWDPYFERRR